MNSIKKTMLTTLGLLAVLSAVSLEAQACTITKTKWGLQGIDCFIQPQPILQLKRPNLEIDRFNTFLSNRAFDVGVDIRNSGPVSTKGGIRILYGSDGNFELASSVEIRRINGALVQFYDEKLGQLTFGVGGSQRIGAMDANAVRSVNLATISLPDRDYNYDVCVLALIDSKNTGSPNGEVVESDETDNSKSFFYRIYADGTVEDPVPYYEGGEHGCSDLN